MLRRYIGRVVLGAVLGGAVIMVAGAAPAPDSKTACESRLSNTRAKLDADISRHGEKSRQADSDRAKLEQARQWCKDHRADYDHDKYDDHHDDDRR